LKLSHFETLAPVCPRCRGTAGEEHPLTLATIAARRGDLIIEGTLHCTNPACQLEYPIIDGIPLLFADIRTYVAENGAQLTARSDLSAETESILGDCLGPNSAFDVTRQHLSAYAWDNYGDLDPAETAAGPVRPNGVGRCLEAGLELLARRLDLPALDIGCAVGRSSFELAAGSSQLVLGIDTNFAMLQVAQRVLQQGRVRYPRRRLGVVYDRRAFDVRFEGSERVDFWACSGMALPFRANGFGLVVALQVLDSVGSPQALLAAVAEVVASGGHALFATPYDWSPAATPAEAWIGGHSQRGPTAGAAEPLLRSLLTPGAHPQSVQGLVLRAERRHWPWHTRLHERSITVYDTHLFVAEARGGAADSPD
jgi:SAM-dependent methyltransferase/uncharacterized protein YbaR (Trm112 family)